MGPMIKLHCGMISLTFNKVDYLLVVGGHGPCITSPQPGTQYSNKLVNGNDVCTNENQYISYPVVKRSIYHVINTL